MTAAPLVMRKMTMMWRRTRNRKRMTTTRKVVSPAVYLLCSVLTCSVTGNGLEEEDEEETAEEAEESEGEKDKSMERRAHHVAEGQSSEGTDGDQDDVVEVSSSEDEDEEESDDDDSFDVTKYDLVNYTKYDLPTKIRILKYFKKHPDLVPKKQYRHFFSRCSP